MFDQLTITQKSILKHYSQFNQRYYDFLLIIPVHQICRGFIKNLIHFMIHKTIKDVKYIKAKIKRNRTI